MLQQLINHNADLKRLFEAGYEMEIDGGHILVHHIPYVVASKQVKYGTLVCVLTMRSPTLISPPQDHTIHFQGETPCNADGSSLVAIINNSQFNQLTATIAVNHFFSSKPATGNYSSYFDKIRTYAEILSAQARVIDPNVTPKPNKNHD